MSHPREVVRFLIKDIVTFHNELQQISKMMDDIRDLSLLESAVNIPFQSCFGCELYPDVFSKAARLCYGITQNHPFFDGNKRTAVHSMIVYLKVNGIEVKYTDEEMEKIIIEVANDQLDDQGLCKWLRQHYESSNSQLISIVLPTYNGARYLRESIESVLRQTTSEWELIIVDDCSTDETPAIADAYARQDARIRVIHNAENQKLPRSLNIGFAAARGEYLTWTSDDNRYLPEALEKMRTYLAAHEDVYLVCARVRLIGADGQRFVSKDFPEGVLPPFRRELMSYCDLIGACFMYRREVLNEIGGYDPGLFCVEDYDYWLRIYERFPLVESIPDFLYEYRFHENSLTTKKRRMVFFQQQRMRRKHLSFLQKDLMDRPDLLLKLFLEMQCQEKFSNQDRKSFCRVVPLLCGLIPLPDEEKCIIYGAGKFGKQLYAKIKTRVVCFADQNPQLARKRVEGCPIYSVAQARKMFPKARFIVAGFFDIAEGMMQTLQNNGILQYSYFPTGIDDLRL